MSTTSTESDPATVDGGPDVSTDLLAGLVLLVIAGGFLVNTGDELLDWIFPRILIYSAGVIGVSLVVKGLFGYGGRTLLTPGVLRGRGRQVTVFVLVSVTVAILVEPVGYWIMSWAMIAGMSAYLSEDLGTRQLIKSALIALAVCLFSFWLFYGVFYIPFPRANWVPFL